MAIRYVFIFFWLGKIQKSPLRKTSVSYLKSVSVLFLPAWILSQGRVDDSVGLRNWIEVFFIQPLPHSRVEDHLSRGAVGKLESSCGGRWADVHKGYRRIGGGRL